jgi:hypothetical protein
MNCKIVSSVTAFLGFGLLVFTGCTDSLTGNHAPMIKEVSISHAFGIVVGENYVLTCIAIDEDKDQLTYLWSSSEPADLFPNGTSTASITYVPGSSGRRIISIVVSDVKAYEKQTLEVFVGSN